MSKHDDEERQPATWRRPTRRVFVTLLGAAAAAVVLPKVAPTNSPRITSLGKTRWIGHC
jgi:uncharacterized membrane protein YccC